MRFILYRGITVLKTQDPLGSEARFLLTDLQPADEGAYTCRYRPRTGPAIYSDASDIIQIEVLDLAKPSISWELVTGVKGEYQIHCSAPEDRKVKHFFLHEGSVTTLIMDRSPPPGRHQVTFPISDSTSMEYRCSYQVQESGQLVESPLSDPVYIRKYAGSPPKPTVEVIPGNVITRGGNLTIRCVGLYPSMRFTLYRGAAVVLPTQDPPGTEATFLLTDLQQEDEGAYTCRYHPRTGPTIYSDASDIIQIKVLDYTTSNIIQIVLAAVVLLILLVILVEHCHSSKGKGNSAPESGHE
ncbi:osteoclast-associated immunoglobulin-like receptor isoform X2 [Ambystoma mexicanum]